jgi:hypothetical protein
MTKGLSRSKILISLMAFTVSSQVLAKTETKTLACNAPKSPLYKAKDANDAIDLKLMAAFPVPANNARNSNDIGGTRGLIATRGADGKIEYNPVILSRRGNSRGMYCEFPPLRLKFVDEQTRARLEQSLADQGLAPGSDEYLAKYYEIFKMDPLNEKALEHAQGAGAFAHLGDDVKLVTHCGKTSLGDMLSGQTTELQNQRLLAEYYIYKILEPLKFTVESARLAHITYLKEDGTSLFSEKDKDANGQEVDFKLAFFREPPKSLAQRCGLISKLKTKTPQEVLEQDPVSYFETDFINKMIGNSDYGLGGSHNINRLYSKDEKTVFFGAYDFDLAAMAKNNLTEDDFRYRVSGLGHYMLTAEKASAYPAMNKALSVRKEMQAVIDQMQLPAERRELFTKWLDLVNSEVKKTFADRKSYEANSSRATKTP